MRRTSLSGAILAILSFCLAGIHVASVADEVEDPTEELLKADSVTTGMQNVEQADEAQRQIAEPLDDAQRIEAMLKAVREIEKRHNIDEHALKFTDQIQKWLAEEKKEQETDDFQRSVADQRERLSRPDFPPQAKKLLAAALRIASCVSPVSISSSPKCTSLLAKSWTRRASWNKNFEKPKSD